MLTRTLSLSLLVMATSAWAQPVEYSLKVSPQDVQTIGTALGARPYVDVQALIAKLQNQIAEQSRPKPEPKPEDAK